MSTKHTLVNRKFRIDNQPGARHSVILDDSPMPKGRRAKLITQIALVDMSLPDSEAILNMFANAPETLRQHGELLEALILARDFVFAFQKELRNPSGKSWTGDDDVDLDSINAAIADCEATKDGIT